MNAYRAQIRMTLRLMMRNRGALFFGYLLPLVFFFMFGQLMRAEQGGASQIVSMVLTIGVLGSGFFGAAMIAVMNREQNVLRRFKVAPIGPAPILVSSLVVSLLNYLPMATLLIILANRVYGMPVPRQLGSLFIFVSLGLLAFCSIGNIVAAVVNSMQEAQILGQLFYMPLLLLGGATIPVTLMPNWLQVLTQYLPSTHYNTGLQAIFRGGETIFDNLAAVGALAATVVVGTFLAIKLFRWEKEEKMRPSAKLWLAAVLGPFLMMGAWQTYAKTNVVKTRVLARTLERSRSWLIRDARVFVGDGSVIERGAVLIRDGKIAEIYKGEAPDPKAVRAQAVDAAGKTLLPGLIDLSVHLASPGAISPNAEDFRDIDGNIDRELSAYLFCGVTAVKDDSGPLEAILRHRAALQSGEKLGAELFAAGALSPKSPQEARSQIAELRKQGVDGIRISAGAGMDASTLKAIAEEARSARLPIVASTADAQGVTGAVAANVTGIDRGALNESLPPAIFAQMKQAGVFYDPILAIIDASASVGAGKTNLFDGSLVQQVAPKGLIERTRQALASLNSGAAQPPNREPVQPEAVKQNLAAALKAGVTLVTGTGSGAPLLFHGPAIHRELQLWVQAGATPEAALQAATYNAARLLGASDRIGAIRQGYEATFLLVDGNPLQDISATERISSVFLKGERVNRGSLLEQK